MCWIAVSSSERASACRSRMLERGIVNLSAGNRIARCACQKGLALKR